MTRRAVLAALLLAVVLAVPAGAYPPSERGAAFNRLEKKTMCIECNVSLNIAEAAQADDTRAQIRRLLDRGLDDEQVLDQLVSDYGPNILATPEPRGFNVLAFVVPIAALAALLALGLILLPRWRRARAAAAAHEAPGTPDDDPAAPTRSEHERLDAELARYGS